MLYFFHSKNVTFLIGSDDSHDSQEVFMNFEYYSLHALVSEVYLVLTLYPSGLHNHYLRYNSTNYTMIQTILNSRLNDSSIVFTNQQVHNKKYLKDAH